MLLTFTPAFANPVASADGRLVAAVATDDAGNAYVAGRIADVVTDFDPARARTAALDPAAGHGFVAKYSAGGRLQWVRQFDAAPGGLAVDGGGNVFMAGTFEGTVDFDPADGRRRYFTASPDAPDAFLVRLDPAGGLLAANAFNTGDVMGVSAVEVDRDGNAVIAGYSGADVAPGPGRDGVVAKFSAKGRNLYVRTLAGGTYVDTAGLAADPVGGGVFVLGLAQPGADLDPSASGVAMVRVKQEYLLKLDAAGGYVWHTGYIPSETSDVNDPAIAALAADEAGDLIVAGSFSGSPDFNPSGRKVFHMTADSEATGYFARFSGATGGLVMAQKFGGAAVTFVSDVEAGGGEVVVGGTFGGVSRADFDPGPGAFRLSPAGAQDAFIARYDAADGSFVDAMRYGHTAEESYPTLARSAAGVVAGNWANVGRPIDFDPSDGVLERAVDVATGFLVRYRLD